VISDSTIVCGVHEVEFASELARTIAAIDFVPASIDAKVVRGYAYFTFKF
jgi:hypothetical protein